MYVFFSDFTQNDDSETHPWVYINVLLLFISMTYSTVWIHHNVLICSLVDKYLGGFQSSMTNKSGKTKSCSCLCVDICFHFFWVDTQEWNT